MDLTSFPFHRFHKMIDKRLFFDRIRHLFPRMRTVRRPAAPEKSGADYRDNNNT